MIHLDAAGEVTGEWATLVDPERDLGPEHVHGITAAHVRDAPRFTDIAGTLAALLHGRVVAAHNLPFDARFISYEFGRLGIDRALDHRHGVCTMSWAAHFLPGDPRTLAHCCAAAGIPLNGRHEALLDARAAAGLLRHYMRRAGPVPPWRRLFDLVPPARTPEPPGTAARWLRRGVPAEPPPP
ncbi:hypothetical protein GCM10022226_74440 [Sphaerisporangium flaviroseum]|uniref:Exonuclease domain-containing protein n=1 Tax=Sphaerisporangium flaviroseum TaxID=509199 RepID=A0ABP7JDK9_9ACTN